MGWVAQKIPHQGNGKDQALSKQRKVKDLKSCAKVACAHLGWKGTIFRVKQPEEFREFLLPKTTVFLLVTNIEGKI